MSDQRKLGLGYFFGAIAAVAIICSVCAAWFVRSSLPRRGERETHNWLHEHLRLTAEQERRLIPLETRFASERKTYLDQVGAANRDLAAAIKTDGRYSPNVDAAIERVHRAQGEFQKATIRHCLEMQEFLTPDQWKELLDMVAQALEQDGD